MQFIQLQLITDPLRQNTDPLVETFTTAIRLSVWLHFRPFSSQPVDFTL